MSKITKSSLMVSDHDNFDFYGEKYHGTFRIKKFVLVMTIFGLTFSRFFL